MNFALMSILEKCGAIVMVMFWLLTGLFMLCIGGAKKAKKHLIEDAVLNQKHVLPKCVRII